MNEFYGSVYQHACGCGRTFDDALALRLHLAHLPRSPHLDASRYRPLSRQEWRDRQADMNRLHAHWQWLRRKRSGQ